MIGVAGFGRRITWNEDKVLPPGYTMTFKDALYEASHRLLWRVIFPEWMLRWGTPTMRKFLRANEELEVCYFPSPCMRQIPEQAGCCMGVHVFTEVSKGDDRCAPVR